MVRVGWSALDGFRYAYYAYIYSRGVRLKWPRGTSRFAFCTWQFALHFRTLHFAVRRHLVHPTEAESDIHRSSSSSRLRSRSRSPLSSPSRLRFKEHAQLNVRMLIAKIFLI